MPSRSEASRVAATGDTTRAVESVFRMEYPRLVASLTRYTGDLGLAEELAQDALVAALEQWPGEGVPRNARGWLLTVAKRRAVDQFRRNERQQEKYGELARELRDTGGDVVRPDLDGAFDDDIDDDVLRLVFTACHPVLSVASRVALTLRLLGGLTTAEIARAYLVPEPTVAQRIVRAKKTLAAAGVPFEVPTGADRAARLASVLEVVYLIFNEGYSATAGDDWVRPELCADALRLGRSLAALVPDEPEVHGLVALMEIQASRVRARVGPDRRAGAAAGPGPRPLGPPAHHPRAGGAAPRGGARRVGAVRAAGADRRLPRARVPPAGHRLGPDRRAVRRARRADPVTGRRAEPRSRGVDGVRPRGRAPARGRARRRARARVATTCCPACAATCCSSSVAPSEARAEFERAATLTRNESEQALSFDAPPRPGAAGGTTARGGWRTLISTRLVRPRPTSPGAVPGQAGQITAGFHIENSPAELCLNTHTCSE